MTHKIAPILTALGRHSRSADRCLFVMINLLFCVAPISRAAACIVGAEMPVSPGLDLHAAIGADTQVCHYDDLQTAINAAPQQDQETRLLEPGKPIEREIGTGQSHSYRLTLAAGQYVYIVVEQRGIDLAVAAVGPDGKKLVEMDSPDGAQGPEPIRLIAAVSGEYRLLVRTIDEREVAARYEARIEELRAPTPRDEIRIAAQTAFAEGMRQVVLPVSVPLRKAIESFDIALPLFRSLEDRSAEADTLRGLGHANSLLGDKQKALDYYRQEAALRNMLGDRWGEADVLDMLGAVYATIGETGQAFDHFRRALPLAQAVNRQCAARTLNNLGALYKMLGDLRQAAENFNQALSALRVERDDRLQATALNNLGQIYSAMGEPRLALDYYNQSLDLSRAKKDGRSEAGALHNIGLAYHAMGDTGKALDYFNRALPILRAVGDQYAESSTLAVLGHVHTILGETENGLERWRRALPLSQATGNRHAEAYTLYHLGRFDFSRGDMTSALGRISEALDVVESLRGKIAGGQLRASYLATAQDYYELSIDMLMQSHRRRPSEGHDIKAFVTSERAIARSLLDSISEARADIRGGVDAALLERERALEQKLVAMTDHQTRLLSRPFTRAQAADVNKEIEAIIGQYQEVQAQIRASSPRYAALTQPAPLNLNEVQRQTLDDNTLLLEYALGRERSYLWAVTPSSIASYELPKRAEIEAAVRRVYESLSAAGGIRASTGKSALEASRALSQMLLGPVAGQLGTRRLLIVATGALQYLPFGSLPLPETERRSDGVTERRRYGVTERKGADPSVPQSLRPSVSVKPLIADHEIVILPSASTLAVLRRELGDRPSAPRQIAVLADPVFDVNDSRVGAGAEVKEAQDQTSRAQLETAARASGLTGFDRLRSSRSEAEAIIALAGGGENLKALDFDASRATATSEQLTQYRVVHFATHGVLDSQHPELSGLILSLVDERGQPRNGFLRTHEVYNLKLGADLVALSGCQTALGKEVKGEGLISLTRGFMYAGAPRVLASLWRVPDKATAELMKRFYRSMLVEGLSAAAALRAAQNSIRKEKRWAAPYYWAAFTLQGEWK